MYIMNDMRERLVESTQELLWERGFAATSPRAILERSGAGQGSMYHHFAGKQELAREALERSAADLKELAEERLGGEGSAIGRVESYLLRERDVLKGCRIGRMTQDVDVVSDPVLRAPVDDTLAWVRSRLASVIREGIGVGEFDESLSPERTAATIAAVLQGGYVLARAAQSVEPFDAAIAGVLDLLRQSAARSGSREGVA